MESQSQTDSVHAGRRALPAIFVAGVLGLWYASILRPLMGGGDYPIHLEYVRSLLDGVLRLPHPLFHAIVAGVTLAGIPPVTAALIVTVASEIAAGLVVYWLLSRDAPRSKAAALAAAVLLTGPVFPQEDNLWMLGYFLPNALHSPTVIVAKVFVPLLLVMTAGAVGLMERFRTVTAAGLVIVAALAKPHYISCILPASLLIASWRRPRVPWKHLALGLVVPSVAMLAWTSIGTVRLVDSGGTATIAPLIVLQRYVDIDALSIVLRLGSDLAFPIAVALLWPAAIARMPPLLIAWIAYAMAFGQAMILAETGPRMFDGNFFWSAQLATFGLMTASAAVLAQRPLREWRSVAAWLVLGLHVYYGITWALQRVQEA